MSHSENDTRVLSVASSFLATVRSLVTPYEQFVELVDTLIDRNDNLRGNKSAWAEPQRSIAVISSLDIQVQNGGLHQFFWNCPHLVEFVGPSLRRIGSSKLAGDFEKAAEQLGGNIDEFVRLREAGGLDDFISSTNAEDFEWFEDIYFGDYDRKAKRWSGLVDQVYQLSTAYMLDHIDSFATNLIE